MLRAAPLLLLAGVALATSACPPPDPNTPTPSGSASGSASAAGPGWKPTTFSKKAEGCSQGWTCDCGPMKAKSGCHLDITRDDATTGVCAADSGPPTGCTRCMALPPAPACACKEVCP
jgi:hypothetical protein